MLRKTTIVLALAAALTGGLTADAVALATGHTGWDGLGDGGGHAVGDSHGARFGSGHMGGPGRPMEGSSRHGPASAPRFNTSPGY